MAELDEFALIRLLTGRRQSDARLRGLGVQVGIGDDAAVTAVTPGHQLVLSCDTMVEGVHFRADTMRASDVGFKAMASSISDMAAMGAVPRYALVSLTVPRSTPAAWLERLYDGLYDCAERYDVAIAGGDTTSTRAGVVVAVTIVGEVESGRALLRSGARPGDVVFVTGPLGGPAAGLDWLIAQGVEQVDELRYAPEQGPGAKAAAGDKTGDAEPTAIRPGPAPEQVEPGPAPEQVGPGPVPELAGSARGQAAELSGRTGSEAAAVPPELAGLVRRHQRPLPEVAAGRLLLASGVCRSLNDVSDGLASEAAELAAASGCGLLLEAAAIPLESGLAAYARQRAQSALDWALYGGEDYRLVGTLEPGRAGEVLAALRESGIPAVAIGVATDAWSGVRLRQPDGMETELTGRGFNHFG